MATGLIYLKNRVDSRGGRPMSRIMVVDDAAFMRMMLSNMLTKMGHKVVAEADNGKTALEMYKKHSPDVVTMDITMPHMNGIEAVKGIIGVDPKAKIVMVSAMGQKEMVIEAVKAGAKDFIVKPFKEDAVWKAIEQAMES
jgi:two-component system chemotaxis response regulator CheY